MRVPRKRKAHVHYKWPLLVTEFQQDQNHTFATRVAYSQALTQVWPRNLGGTKSFFLVILLVHLPWNQSPCPFHPRVWARQKPVTSDAWHGQRAQCRSPKVDEWPSKSSNQLINKYLMRFIEIPLSSRSLLKVLHSKDRDKAYTYSVFKRDRAG